MLREHHEHRHDPLARLEVDDRRFDVRVVEPPELEEEPIDLRHVTEAGLRPGVKRHDGAPFTSGDVVFTQTVLLNPDVDVRGNSDCCRTR